MFTEKRLMFLYAVTPVHMGAGTAIGVVDNPIQREVHTKHPVFAGSGIKGAMRDAAPDSWKTNGLMDIIFGPEREGSDHAGACSFADGQIVAFPVRCLKEGFVYITSPYALQRLARLAAIAGIADYPQSQMPKLEETKALVLSDSLLADNRLILETYAFDPVGDGKDALSKVAEWIANNALPQGSAHDFFRKKLQSDLVLLNDCQFSFFVRNSTAVEPHVRINDSSGTADEGGLFFTENLPPESVMVSLAMASMERRKKGDPGEGSKEANALMEMLIYSFGGKPLQIGGDATTGRGQVVVSFVGGDSHANT